MQSVAEHVLAAARHAATGRIGLRVQDNAITTPPYPTDSGPRTLAIEGTDLVVTDDGGRRHHPLTTIGAAARAAGTMAGAPTDVFTPSTFLHPDEPLDLDPDAVRELLTWYGLGQEALDRTRTDLAAHDASEIELWPEHFDLAFTSEEVNYGASPGDADHPLPYLYVGPWSPPEPDGGYWNESFGASIGSTAITSPDDAVAFFREGRRLLDAD